MAKQQISTKDLSEIITKAIQDEPYFSKEVLIPKITALIKGFRLSLASVNYSKNLDEKGTAKLIRANELHNLEKEFWKQKLKNIIGSNNMQDYYDMLDEERKKWENKI